MITAFFGIWVNVLVAVVKEMLDEYDYDGFDWKDIDIDKSDTMGVKNHQGDIIAP